MNNVDVRFEGTYLLIQESEKLEDSDPRQAAKLLEAAQILKRDTWVVQTTVLCNGNHVNTDVIRCSGVKGMLAYLKQEKVRITAIHRLTESIRGIKEDIPRDLLIRAYKAVVCTLNVAGEKIGDEWYV